MKNTAGVSGNNCCKSSGTLLIFAGIASPSATISKNDISLTDVCVNAWSKAPCWSRLVKVEFRAAGTGKGEAGGRGLEADLLVAYFSIRCRRNTLTLTYRFE